MRLSFATRKLHVECSSVTQVDQRHLRSIRWTRGPPASGAIFSSSILGRAGQSSGGHTNLSLALHIPHVGDYQFLDNLDPMKTLCQGSAYLKITQYRSSGSAVGRHTGFTASLNVWDVHGVAAGGLDQQFTRQKLEDLRQLQHGQQSG